MKATWLLFVLLLGCAPASIPVYVDADAPERLVLATGDAVDFWNARLDGPVQLELRVASAPRAGYLHPGALVVIEVDNVHLGTDAFTAAGVFVNRTSVQRSSVADPEVPLSWVMTHELGHFLGLRHATDPSNVMFADPWWTEEGLETTAAQRRRVRACTWLKAALL